MPSCAPSQAQLSARPRTWGTNPPWAQGCRELSSHRETENLPPCLFFLARCPLTPKPPPPPCELGTAAELEHGPIYNNELALVEVRSSGAGSMGSAGSVGRGHAVWLLTLGSPCSAQLCPRAVGTCCPLARVATVTWSRTPSRRMMVSTQTPCVRRR